MNRGWGGADAPPLGEAQSANGGSSSVNSAIMYSADRGSRLERTRWRFAVRGLERYLSTSASSRSFFQSISGTTDTQTGIITPFDRMMVGATGPHHELCSPSGCAFSARARVRVAAPPRDARGARELSGAGFFPAPREREQVPDGPGG